MTSTESPQEGAFRPAEIQELQKADSQSEFSVNEALRTAPSENRPVPQPQEELEQRPSTDPQSEFSVNQELKEAAAAHRQHAAQTNGQSPSDSQSESADRPQHQQSGGAAPQGGQLDPQSEFAVQQRRTSE